MPRGKRNLDRKDYTQLLEELHGNSSAETPAAAKEKAHPDTPVPESVRRRSRLLSDSRNKYIYSSRWRVLHDRDCSAAKHTPAEDFEMLTDFNRAMRRCRQCTYDMLIRAGITDTGKYMAAYRRFFQAAGATEGELMRLFVIEKGSLRKISNSCMEIRVREDTWRIVREADHLILLHNNYVMTSPNTRAIVSDYHVQRFREEPTFHVIVREICTYRWKQHLIHKAKETEKRERAARKAALELALSTTYNYMPLESRSLRYQQYRFVDYGRRGMKKMKNSYPAFQILGQLPLSGGGGHLRLVTCQIPRRSKNVFLSIMEEIKQSSADSQFEPYLTVCRRMISQNDAIRLRNVSSMIERLLMMHKSF